MQIDVRIKLTDGQTLAGSQWLQNLGSRLQRELEIPYKSENIDSPDDTMAGDITVAISIIGLSLTAFNTALALIRYYKEQSRRGQITITGDGYSWTKSDLTDEEIKAIIQDIEKKKLKDVVISINH